MIIATMREERGRRHFLKRGKLCYCVQNGDADRIEICKDGGCAEPDWTANPLLVVQLGRRLSLELGQYDRKQLANLRRRVR